jgi:hypothetical protein
MVQHTLVQGSDNFYYMKASKTTWSVLRNAKGMTSFPGALNRATPPATPESIAAAEAAAAGLESPAAVAIDDVSNVAAAAAAAAAAESGSPESLLTTTDAATAGTTPETVDESNATSATAAR